MSNIALVQLKTRMRNLGRFENQLVMLTLDKSQIEWLT